MEDDDQLLFFNPTDAGVGITPKRTVALSLGKADPRWGFSPKLRFAVELTPAEALWLGGLLIRKAREAEGGSSPET